MFDQYGYFTGDGNEYTVKRFDTPLPWTNYLTNGDDCAIVTSTGGGFSFYRSHHANMILRREQRNLISDTPGRYVYVRDRETGEYWTVNVMPVKKKHESFQAIHGLGYTQIQSVTDGIEGKLLFFVPTGFDAEVVRLKLQNRTGRKRLLSVFFYEELQLGNYYFNEHERTITSMFQEVKHEDGVIYGRYKLWSTSREAGDNFRSPNVWPYTVFVTSTTPANGFETSQERFIGVHREVHTPLSVEQGRLSDCDNSGSYAVAAFQWNVELDEGAGFETDILTGISETGKTAGALERIRKPGTIDEFSHATQAFWRDYIGGITIRTPDPEVDRNFNNWNKYQLYMNFSFGRAPSYYHLEQSMGMRDSFQDAFGMIPLNPAKAREQILRVAGFLFGDGSPCDVTSRIEYKAHKGIKVDVPLWMALAVCNYIKETGEWGILDEVIPYLDGGEGTLYEHILKGIQRVAREPGIYGLPLFGGGDWNDSLNRVGEKGKGESTWLAQFIYFSINEIEPLLQYRKDTDRLDFFKELAERIRMAHEHHCWDGEWYLIGYNDHHEPVGTKTDRVGRVYLNTQTWAVISGIGSMDRLEKAMDTVDQYLETEYGMALVWPPYDHLDENIGVSSAFAPGLKENGAVFSHATAFNLVGKALLGRGNDLYRVYKKVLPSGKDPDIYKLEPYIYSQFAAGPGSPNFGRGAYHWMTGTAAWMFRVVLDYMLGVRADYDGLVIDPCIPSHWKEYEVKRTFRGCVYEIRVTNPKGVQKGVGKVWVDGVEMNGNRIVTSVSRRTCSVEVMMG